jgi:flagellar FliJ protein
VKGFTFKLEAVLEQRRLTERLRQGDVATAQRALLKVQAEVDALGAVGRSSAADLRAGGQRLSAALLAAHQRFALAMRQKVAALNRQMADARGDLDHAQSKLIEAAKQRKVIEKLREKEHARWLEAQRKRDLIEADEVARRMQDGETPAHR